MSCPEDTCYGVLAVHRICFALTLFHGMLAILLLRVRNTRQKMAVMQNGWWGPKVLIWLLLVSSTFSIPNGFFMFYLRYITWLGSIIFIFFGLVLLVDFAYVFGDYVLLEIERCADMVDWRSKLWVNPGSGVIQSGVVVIYCTQLVTSAVANQDDGDSRCNPLTKLQEGTETSMVVLGAIMTLLAVAYTTFRAGTRSFEFMGMMNESAETGYVALRDADPERPILAPITAQPKKKDPLRIQAIQAAVDEGSLPASALDDELRQDQDDDDNDREDFGALDKDDETIKVRYHYSSFHLIFVLATMYVAMLLTHWNIVTRIGHIPPIDSPASKNSHLRCLLR
ncbi:hypothetical protein PSTT_07126 [Puccinia striiformis]|uniref:Uncharacterized protein n=1 Tax=Puccinia striiformis TaxID=27350 RepID=A0A2S4VHT2_9BASI|nr:hypothetical protein PSTT_07126 [Puccinia striiformis]